MSAIAELRHLLRGSGFRRLAGARLLSQLGDGMFQAGLASLLFFDPTKETSAAGIALGFLLLLAPFTFVGPFVGPLIDRWQRQRILLVGNLVRLVLAGVLAYLMVIDGPNPLIYVVALVTLSLNRFLLAAMTAAIPRVVADDDLLTANALLPTLGTLAALLGAGVGVVVTFFAPGLPEHLQSLSALSLAGVTFGLSSWATSTIGRRELGP
ncbi:MAG: MFS transporter, partial [Demequinaceae bacterium]|nr:MFS transporter [Demequinaceae bacterium]